VGAPINPLAPAAPSAKAPFRDEETPKHDHHYPPAAPTTVFAALRHPAAWCLQRQPVQERGRVLHGLQRFRFRQAGSQLLGGGLGAVHPALFLLSALAGQLADMRDKARIIRWIKLLEIGIMVVGGGGLLLAWQHIATHTLAVPLMLLALLGMGVHSTFFGPIKYAILPQHLKEGEVLAGTGLVEAGTYIAILAGTILAGWIRCNGPRRA
jgi:MFS family permease